MTTINPNQEGKPLKPLTQRLEIKEGMTVKEVQEKGNAAQKAAATIFDVNGNGTYNYQEAYDFSHTRITNDTEKGEIRLYDEKGKKLKKTVNIEAEKQDYAKRTAQRQKFEQTLTRYGINISSAEWVGINDCSTQTINGKTYLVLKATPKYPSPDKNSNYDIEDHYKLSIPIDKNFDPHKIKMYRAREDEANVHFENINGTLTILGDETRGHGFAFGGNSNVTVIGKDGVADLIALEDNAKVTVKSGDYADAVDDRTKILPADEEIPFEHMETIYIKPGTTTVKSAKIK